MIERRHPSELYSIELERARAELSSLLKNPSSPVSEIRRITIRAKELEVRLLSARLAQAEYYLTTLKARLGFLEARSSASGASTRSEEQELTWARDAIPSNSAAVLKLAEELSRLKEELRMLASQAAA